MELQCTWNECTVQFQYFHLFWTEDIGTENIRIVHQAPEIFDICRIDFCGALKISDSENIGIELYCKIISHNDKLS
jgi:hypothetical protein